MQATDQPVIFTEERAYMRNAHAPYVARLFTSSQLLIWGVPELVEASGLVISELVTNAVTHARSDLVGVQLQFREGPVMIKVWDADGARFPETSTAGDPLPESGRGLLLVEAVASHWGSYRASPTGKVVWALITSGV